MINVDTPVYDFIRLRSLNGEPMSLDSTVMPLNLVPGLNKAHLESSVFQYVQETLGLKIMGSYRVVRALNRRRLICSICCVNKPIRYWKSSRLSIWRTVRRWNMLTATTATITGGIVIVNNG